jgi:hypothetical protein
LVSEAFDRRLLSEEADDMCLCIRWIALPITSATEDELEEAYAFPGVVPAAVCESVMSDDALLVSSDVILGVGRQYG